MVDAIRTVTVRGRSDGLDKLAADLAKVVSAQGRVAQSSEGVARASETSARRQDSLARAAERWRARNDQVARAQQQIARELQQVDRYLDAGVVSVNEYTSALDRMRTKLQDIGAPTVTVDQSGLNQMLGVRDIDTGGARASAAAFQEAAQEAERMEAAAMRLRAQIDPLGAAQDRLNAELAEYQAMASAGAISTGELAAANGLAQQRFAATSGVMGGVSRAAQLNTAQMANLSYQFNDIAVMLASGQNPFIMLMQQGMQISQVFGPGTGVRGAMQALGTTMVSFVTNPLNLAVVGFAAAAGGASLLWNAVSNSSGAEQALERHKVIIDEITKAYRAAKDSGADWRDSLSTVTLTEAEGIFRSYRDQMQDALDEIRAPIQNTLGRMQRSGSPFLAEFEGYNRLIEAVQAGDVPMTTFLKRLDQIAQNSASEALRDLAAAEQENVQTLIPFDKRLGEAAQTVEALGGATEETNRYIGRSADAFDRAARGAKTYSDALEQLKSHIPDLRTEFQKIQDDFQAAFDAAPTPAALLAASQARTEAMRGANDNQRQSALGEVPLSGSFVDRVIGVESGGDPYAKNPLSSATGAGQFIDSTWTRLFKQEFPSVAAGMADSYILSLRTNLDYSKSMVEAYARENALVLSQASIDPTDRNLYLAHFLGAGGAVKALQADPSALAADVLGQGAARANPTVLGGGRSIGDVLSWAGGKMDSARIAAGDLTDMEKQSVAVEERAAAIQHETEQLRRNKVEQEIYNELTQLGIERDSEHGRVIEAQVRQRVAQGAAVAASNLLAEGQRQIDQLNEQQKATAMTAREAAAFRFEQERLNQAIAQGIPVTDNLRASIVAQGKAYADAAFAAEDAKRRQDEVAEAQQFFAESGYQLFRGMMDGADGFKDSLDRVIGALIDASLQAALLGQGPLAGLFGMAAPAGGVGGLFGSLLGAFTPRANGGPVSAGGAYLVGERGPEPFFPNVSGMILPTETLRGGAANNNAPVINYSQQIDARGADPAAIARLERALEADKRGRYKEMVGIMRQAKDRRAVR